jgi:hypothetical protein
MSSLPLNLTHHIVPLTDSFGVRGGVLGHSGGVRFRSTGLGICQGWWLVREHRSRYCEGNN